MSAMKDETKIKNAAKTASANITSKKEDVVPSVTTNGLPPLTKEETKLLHEGLAALRAEDEQHPPEPVLKSIPALIAWTACDLGVNELVIRELIKLQFGPCDEKAEIGSDYYDTLVRFLEALEVKQHIQ